MDSESLGLGLTVRVFLDGPGGGRGVTLVKEDEIDEPGELEEPGCEPGELGGKLGELGGPRGIANLAKLSLISFNNFIAPSS